MRIFFLVTVILFLHCRPAEPSSRRMLTRACTWLWAQQGADGGWHSRTHGIMKSGQALTPFVLFALLEVPEGTFPRPVEKVRKGLDFVRRSIAPDGRLGYGDRPVLDYPNYATAYALRLLARHGAATDSAHIRRMTRYLLAEQFDESRGIDPEHPAYGGWGFGETLPSGAVGHIDLSHTRRVLQGLQDAGVQDSLVRKQALVFLGLLQKDPADKRPQPPGPPGPSGRTAPYDGGFYASPVTLGLNKGGLIDGDPAYFPSYATATADGLLALLSCELEPGDQRLKDAAAWLEKHPDWAFAEGIPTDAASQWHRVLRLYHVAARAEAGAALGWDKSRLAPGLNALKEFQQPDGRFFNPEGAPNKEDDPLVGTALALTALINIGIF
jgi:hypothetical protein